ncbi:cyclophilin-type peptidyl-prolyl cis-trans isomerase [Chloropicon primus]|nr:cyclophilin-type peptidyl-prolyl cis-trans isomerase [Chloropicon primus]
MPGPMPGPEEDGEGLDEMVGPMPGPMPEEDERPKRKRRKKNLPYEKAYLDALPCSEMYEKSYMHRDDVTHILSTGSKSDFVITASRDGFIKFWKKGKEGIEFVKVFRAHLTHITSMACSLDGALLATASEDRQVKIFDVSNFDMISMIGLHARPTSICWTQEKGDTSSQLRLAIGFHTGSIHVVDHLSATATRADSKDVTTEAIFKGHRAPVMAMAYNQAAGTMVSVDRKGVVEYWRMVTEAGGTSFESFPPDATGFKYKTDTHLFDLAKAKCTALSLSVSPDGKYFACMCTDFRIRLFSFATGKLKRVYDETLEASQSLQDGGSEAFALEDIDFGRRLAIEKKYQAALQRLASLEGDVTNQDIVSTPNAVFDESSNFLIYSTLLGVKVVNIHTNKVSRMLGKVENTERFTHVALYQGVAQSVASKAKLSTAIQSGVIKGIEADPTLFACAFKKGRFYLFSKREPEDCDDVTLGRDIFNEKPVVDEFLPEAEGAKADSKLAKEAVLHTTYGDIRVELYGDKCPKTVENFTVHSRNNYYQGVIFHRVIKGFMIQTGDPLGDGTGGESCWGGEFEDEIDPDLKHDRPYTLSMANCGPNTNGSQFFITTVPCTWLDGKHTVFGRVTKGADVCYTIERVKVDTNDKPLEDIKIQSVTVTN